MDKNSTLCCPKCGNIHLQERVWVDINTNEIVGDCEDFEYWCDYCEEFISFKDVCTVSEFEKKKPDVSLS